MSQFLGPGSLEAMVRKAESHRTENVLMLFRCTENPPENAILPPAELQAPAWRPPIRKTVLFGIAGQAVIPRIPKSA